MTVKTGTNSSLAAEDVGLSPAVYKDGPKCASESEHDP